MNISSKATSPIVYVEIPAPKVNELSKFYESVFGWHITPSDLTDEPYSTFTTGEGKLSGGFNPKLTPISAGILLYLKVSDIKEKLKQIKEEGGECVFDKAPVGGDFGHSAQFVDPAGNIIGLWAPS